MADIAFFQAAATAIPTLVVAVAASGKYLNIDTYTKKEMSVEQEMRANYTLGFVALAFFMSAILGERAALMALAESDPTAARARWVTICLSTCISIIASAVIYPLHARGFQARLKKRDAGLRAQEEADAKNREYARRTAVQQSKQASADDRPRTPEGSVANTETVTPSAAAVTDEQLLRFVRGGLVFGIAVLLGIALFLPL